MPSPSAMIRMRVAHRLEIIERLAHAHHHDIGDAALAASAPRRRSAASPPGQSPSRSRAAITWPTISPAVRLRTRRCVPVWQKVQLSVQPTWLETHKRAALGVGDIDAFDFVRQAAVGIARQPQQPFARAVDRDLLGHHFGAVEREMRGQFGAQFLRHAAHGVERGEAAEIDPVPELLHAHLALRLRHADGAERVGKLGARQPDQRRLRRRHIALERRLLDEGRRGRCHFDRACHRIRPSCPTAI